MLWIISSMRKVLIIFLIVVYTVTQRKTYFVIRAKSSQKYRRIYSAKVDKATEVRCASDSRLTGYYTAKGYPENMRRVKYYDKESERTFVFLTNNMEVTAVQVALLYKNLGK